MADLRLALRLLRKSPAFTLAAVATIALGIGANTAIFSVIHGVLLRPLPYAAPDELVMVWQDMRARGGPANEWATPGNLADWRAQTATFASMASIRNFAPALTGMGDAQMLAGEQVSHGYFDVLGVQPVKGRAFTADEALPNAPRVVIISDRFWRDRFGAVEDVLTKQLILAGEPHQIVGVMPPGFRPVINPIADIWRPDRLNLANPARGAIVLRIIARLKNGVSLSQASAAMATVAQDLSTRFPEFNSNVGILLEPLHERVVGNARPGMLLLLGAVMLVLLIACVNIANLLLARASGRSREMAVRTALGAPRGRVIRQLMIESLVLAVLGGVAGVILSIWGVQAFVALAPAGTPRLDEIGLDVVVLAVAAGVTVLTGLLFGLVPALQLARVDHTPALKEGARGSSAGSGQRLRRGLIVAEVAIALMLLVGGGLLLRSFAALERANLGFDPAGVVSAFVPVAGRFPTPEAAIAFQDRLLDQISHAPGVTRAALSSIVPLGAGGDSDMDFVIEGVAPPPPDRPGPVAWYRLISPEYLDVMGIAVTSGRSFEGREAMPAVIVSDTLARRYWPGVSPVGRRVRFGPVDDGTPWFTIIGVVADVSQQGARAEARGQLFLPYWHAGALFAGGTNVLVKSAAAPDAVARGLRTVIREMDPRVPMSTVRPMTELVATSIDEPRFLAVITTVFAALAVLLAAVGVYGVMAYAVTERRQEFGVRLALGARHADVFRLVLSDGVRLTAMGLVLGGIGAALIAPALTSLLYGVTPLDLLTFGAMALVLLAVAISAVVIPARRATRLNPVTTLRGD